MTGQGLAIEDKPLEMPRLGVSRFPQLLLLLGIAALALPTFVKIAQVSWVSEQGAHGPIVLAIALWLVWRSRTEMLQAQSPGLAMIGYPALAGSAIVYVLAYIAGSVAIESFAFYGFVLSAMYLLIGARAMARSWFPLLYFVFVLPPPGSVVAWATQPLRLEISELAVQLYGMLGYPVAREGLQILVGQYVLEVKAACGGLNSMLSLTAISLFYVYATGRLTLRSGPVFFALAIALAIFANFARVCLLMAITYHIGGAAAEGFLHQFAGMFTFSIALFGVMAIANLAEKFALKKHSRGEPLK